MHLTDEDLVDDTGLRSLTRRLVGLALLVVVLAPFAAAGLLVNVVPATLVLIAGLVPQAPVSKGTIRFLVAMVAFPLTWLAIAVWDGSSGWVAGTTRGITFPTEPLMDVAFSGRQGIVAGLVVFAAAPLFGAAALLLVDRTRALLKGLVVWRTVIDRRGQLPAVRERRAEVVAATWAAAGPTPRPRRPSAPARSHRSMPSPLRRPSLRPQWPLGRRRPSPRRSRRDPSSGTAATPVGPTFRRSGSDVGPGPLMAERLLATSDCEACRDGWISQPVNTASSLAYVATGALLARDAQALPPRARTATRVLAATIAAAGLGSVLYHGPGGRLSRWAHDATLVAASGLLAQRDLAITFDRPPPGPAALSVVPVAAMAACAPRTSAAAQMAVGAVAIGAAVSRRVHEADEAPATAPLLHSGLGRGVGPGRRAARDGPHRRPAVPTRLAVAGPRGLARALGRGPLAGRPTGCGAVAPVPRGGTVRGRGTVIGIGGDGAEPSSARSAATSGRALPTRRGASTVAHGVAVRDRALQGTLADQRDPLAPFWSVRTPSCAPWLTRTGRDRRAIRVARGVPWRMARRVAVAALLLLAACSGSDEGPTTPTTTTTEATTSSVPPPPSGALPTGLGDPLYPELGAPGMDVQHYEVDLTVDEELAASGTVTLTIEATEDLTQVAIDARSLTVEDVTLDGEDVDWVHEEPELLVRPGAAIAAGTTFDVDVAFVDDPDVDPGANEVGPGWIRAEDGAYSFTVDEPEATRDWLPSLDHPSDKATWRFTITPPPGATAVANGVPVTRPAEGEDGPWVWEVAQPMATYLAQVLVGPWAVRERPSDDGTRRIDALLTDEVDAHDALIASVDPQMAYLRSVLGPYPFATYGVAVVDEELGLAIEQQTRSLFSADAASPDVGVHELAHQWFGDSVTPARWSDVWLAESFATYAEWLWAEDQGGPTTGEQAEEALAQRREDGGPPTDAPTAATLFGFNVYEGGAVVVEALRREVGDEAFFALLTRWLADNAGTSVTTEDLTSPGLGGRRAGPGRLLRPLVVGRGAAARAAGLSGARPTVRTAARPGPAQRRATGVPRSAKCEVGPGGEPGERHLGGLRGGLVVGHHLDHQGVGAVVDHLGTEVGVHAAQQGVEGGEVVGLDQRGPGPVGVGGVAPAQPEEHPAAGAVDGGVDVGVGGAGRGAGPGRPRLRRARRAGRRRPAAARR